ncbi:Dabb family protein [Phytoactinopolyspora endophytica]|uniref:Dabb family protein n=1 Tax=Phytoactinopolyspora endophytica TaxID=1642495 RepID=UPI00101C2885|nr:Dabb family protein [Phytoactinopolyspora endophytica]
MIRHVVSWTLTDQARSDRTGTLDEMRRRLEPLVGLVPGLRNLWVGADLGVAQSNWDVVLISEHDSAEALQDYQDHPAHLEAVAYVKTVVTERACVDVEV